MIQAILQAPVDLLYNGGIGTYIKASFETDKLVENLATFMEAIMAAKPPSLKNIYVQRVTLTSTMGPGIRVDTTAASMMRSGEA